MNVYIMKKTYLTNINIRPLTGKVFIGADRDPCVALVPRVQFHVHRIQDIFEVGPHLQSKDH